MRQKASFTSLASRGSTHARADAENSPAGTKSLREAAYEAIKHRIITCAFRPGEYINELQLSALLKIGRTPVHQALDRLMMEGMVEVIPRKGVIVKPASLNDVLQISEVRIINEPYGARLAAERADDADIAELADIVKRSGHWASLRNVENMMLLDRDFHLLIARAARNRVLGELLRSLHERSLRFWFISLNVPSQYQSVQHEHAAILSAIRRRDSARAEAAMRRHVESFRANVSRFL
jgi:GntR family transcriptional regulator, rspAB operon transcriptional repressor